MLSERPLLSPEPAEESLCFHCRLPLERGKTWSLNEKRFCCRGCLSVFELLQSSGLSAYYSLTSREESSKSLQDYNPELKFSHFDETCETERSFYLEGVHCLACLWLIESSEKHVEGVCSVRLNMSKSQVTVKLGPGGRFSEVASWFNRLGYFPHLLKETSDGNELLKKENHQMLKRIGVAAFSAGNIMILAISVYSGAQDAFFRAFSWLSALLYTPSFLYSAWPFYRNAYFKLREGQLALDVPISVILIFSSLVSYWAVYTGADYFYFDSLSAFTLLLLSARYFLRRVQQRHSATQNVRSLFESAECLRLTGGRFERTNVAMLKRGDRLLILAGESVPLDLQLESAQAYVNTALITGEPLPKLFQRGDTIPAGAIVSAGAVEGQALRELEDCELGAILESVERSWLKNGEETEFSDRLANYLMFSAFVLSTLLLIYFGLQGKWIVGLERAMAVLIVTCPCALGLGVPLILIRGLKNLFKRQIVVRNGAVLSRIARVKNVFLDKTGTLTQGRFSVVAVHGEINDALASKIYAIEKNSLHPAASSLCRYLADHFTLDASLEARNVKEELGSGITALFAGEEWKIMKSSASDFDVDVFRGGQKLLSFRMDDPVRGESLQVLNSLREKGKKVFMLTGDHRRKALVAGRELGFEPEDVIADQVPASKAEMIRISPRSLMVGDGYNDAVAFNEATVGVALGRKVDLQLKNADVFIPSGELRDLLALFEEADATQRRLLRNAALSLSYNTLAIMGAVLGFITPLAAAILMPLSSLTVLASSVWKDKK
jgi:P-type E1-E2 ATPase